MSTIRLLSICWDPAQDVEYVIIELNNADVLKLAERKKKFIAAKELDADLLDASYRASDAIFYQSVLFEKDVSDDGSGSKDENGEPLTFDASELLGDEHIMFLDDHYKLVEEQSTEARVVLDHVSIDEEGVTWCALPKHGDGDLRTEMLRWKALFQGRL